jgi:hypothetical protein
VNHPFAPEWNRHLENYTTWWNAIIAVQQKVNCSLLTITPEFGPFPYMPQAPFTQAPLSNQWEVNLQMKDYLKQNLSLNDQ